MKLQELREKYPMYNTIPDDVLRAKVSAKYPTLLDDMPASVESQKDQASLENTQLNNQRLRKELSKEESRFAPSRKSLAEFFIPDGGGIATPSATPSAKTAPQGSGKVDFNKIEEDRRAAYLQSPDDKANIDAFYDSLTKQADPYGVEHEKAKKLATKDFDEQKAIETKDKGLADMKKKQPP